MSFPLAKECEVHSTNVCRGWDLLGSNLSGECVWSSLKEEMWVGLGRSVGGARGLYSSKHRKSVEVTGFTTVEVAAVQFRFHCYSLYIDRQIEIA